MPPSCWRVCGHFPSTFPCLFFPFVITMCADLENVPCLLVLVEKGRLGDTFPFSLDCMDLRVRAVTGAGEKGLSPSFLLPF